jgi:hypothetical protein
MLHAWHATPAQPAGEAQGACKARTSAVVAATLAVLTMAKRRAIMEFIMIRAPS